MLCRKISTWLEPFFNHPHMSLVWLKDTQFSVQFIWKIIQSWCTFFCQAHTIVHEVKIANAEHCSVHKLRHTLRRKWWNEAQECWIHSCQTSKFNTCFFIDFDKNWNCFAFVSPFPYYSLTIRPSVSICHTLSLDPVIIPFILNIPLQLCGELPLCHGWCWVPQWSLSS